MTCNQQKITKRQDLLTAKINGAISLDYISNVNRVLSNGYEVKTITLNPDNGSAARLLAYNSEAQGKYINVTESVMIQGVKVHYIICE